MAAGQEHGSLAIKLGTLIIVFAELVRNQGKEKENRAVSCQHIHRSIRRSCIHFSPPTLHLTTLCDAFFVLTCLTAALTASTLLKAFIPNAVAGSTPSSPATSPANETLSLSEQLVAALNELTGEVQAAYNGGDHVSAPLISITSAREH